MRKALSRMGQVISASGISEGATEGAQEIVSIIAEEMAQTWNGQGTSLATAIENIANKIEENQTPFDLKQNACISF